MTTAGEIAARVSKTLFDEAHGRWAETEIIGYVSDAQREVALLKPSAYTLNSSIQLEPGTTQSLPANGALLIDVLSSMGADGLTPGQSVTQIDRTVLESVRPNWRTVNGSMATRHFIYDDRDPLHFEVYPPQPDPAGYLQITYAAIPAVLVNAVDVIALADIYVTPIYYLALARCFAKTTGAQDFNKASAYQQLGVSLITGRKQSKQEIHPEQLQERVKR